uniref:Glycerol-3-phosphate transporter-like n=1 Tax=Sinocyclocheilus rhinocerous TaxID=307959 RepID=A0A673FU63_9TELE
SMAPVPPGIRFLTSFNRDQWYRAFTFGLTFLLYTSFHLSRKPISIVKVTQPLEWVPNNYKQLLGAMDYSFLCAYAIGMYLSGIIGERLPIRLYLTVGMLTSGLFTCFVHTVHKSDVGFQSSLSGMTSLLCNFAGELIELVFFRQACQYSFQKKSINVVCIGLVNIRFHVVFASWDTELLLGQESIGVCVPVQQVVVVKSEAEPSAISFMGALRIPGVVEFSLCLLFAKLVSYTFLFWLPLYITKAAHLDAKKAGDLSTLFDVGGIVGGILAGVLSDKLGKRATTCAVMLLLAAPTLYGFSMMSQFGFGPTIGMLLVCGGLVNGPYSLITTAVSADLGTHKSLKGNARALSTVTAIIDGTGSVGAAVGPLLAGLLSARGWDQVFYMLMTADFLALLLLLRLVMKEHRSHRNRPGVAVE